MNKKLVSRRSFFARAESIFTASLAYGAFRSAGRTTALRLGGPIFIKSEDPAVLAKAHRELGYRAAYAPEVHLADTDRIKAIIEAFAAQDVIIAEVGAWVNMLDPDIETRRKNLAYVTERLALAEALSARCCVDIAGSYNPTLWWGPHRGNLSHDFFDATVENVRKLIDTVKPQRTTFSIETSPWSIPDGPDLYLKLVNAVDRKAFGVHLDVCNIVNDPHRMYNSGLLIRECFRQLGRWIVSCHAKDLQWDIRPPYQICVRETVPGRGVIDYKTWLLELSRLSPNAPLMMEHLQTPEEYIEGRRYIQSVARSLRISFGALECGSPAVSKHMLSNA